MNSLLDPEVLQWLRRLQLRVDGRVRSTQRGERRSVRRGSGGDFIDTRAYAAGDDLRHLDWHLYARLDQLMIRLYEAPKDHALHILLDVSPSMNVDDKLVFARRLCAAVGFLTLHGGDRVSVTTFCREVLAQIGPLRSRKSAPKLLQFLDETSNVPGSETHISAAAERLVATRTRGTVMLVSDLLTDDGLESLRTLASARLRVAVLHVLSPTERNPKVGEDLTLVDSETGQEMAVQVDRRLRAAYLDRLASFTEELRDTSKSYGFAFIDVSTGTPIEDLLFGDLRQSGLVR